MNEQSTARDGSLAAVADRAHELVASARGKHADLAARAALEGALAELERLRALALAADDRIAELGGASAVEPDHVSRIRRDLSAMLVAAMRLEGMIGGWRKQEVISASEIVAAARAAFASALETLAEIENEPSVPLDEDDEYVEWLTRAVGRLHVSIRKLRPMLDEAHRAEGDDIVRQAGAKFADIHETLLSLVEEGRASKGTVLAATNLEDA